MAESTAKKAAAKKTAPAAKKAAAPAPASTDAPAEETTQSGAPLQADVDPDTVTPDAPNGTTTGVDLAAGVDRTVPLAEAVDYDAPTPGELADAERLANASIAGDDGLLLDGSDVDEDDLYEEEGEFVRLKRDVTELFYFPDTKRPSYRLVFTAGQLVPKSAVKDHNELVKATLEATAPVDGEAPAGDETESEDA